MAKFKVGDKVRVISTSHTPNMTHRDRYIGKILTIKSVNPNGTKYSPDGHYGFGGDAGVYLFFDDELELAGFTKSDLKDGMIVEFRNHSRCPYMMVVGGELRGPNGWEDLNRYDDDLTFVGSIFNSVNDELTIDKVYTTKNKHLDEVFNTKYFELVWDRPCEIEYVEMTVEEIEKQLGHKVKVVGEKNG